MDSGFPPTTAQSFIPFTLEATLYSDDESEKGCRPQQKPKIMRLFPLKPAFQPFKKKLLMENFFENEENQRAQPGSAMVLRGEGQLPEPASSPNLSSASLTSGCVTDLEKTALRYRLPPGKPLLELSLVPSAALSSPSIYTTSVDSYDSGTTTGVQFLELAEGLRGSGSGNRSTWSDNGACTSMAGQSVKGVESGSSSRTSYRYAQPSSFKPASLGYTTAAATISNHGRRPSTRHGPRPRSSSFRGVTHYKRTGRWEAHIWNKGKQIYLGASSTAEKAARAYDRAAIHFRRMGAELNFYLEDYAGELRRLVELSEAQLVTMLRKQSAGEGKPVPEYPPRTEPESCPRLTGARDYLADSGFGARQELAQMKTPVSYMVEVSSHKMQVDANSVSCTRTWANSTAGSDVFQGESKLHVPRAVHVSKRNRQYLQVIDDIRGDS